MGCEAPKFNPKDNTMADITDIRPSTKTSAAMRNSIENELRETKIKEVRGKLKQLIVDLHSAKKVVAAKEAEIDSLIGEYSDVFEA